MKIAYVILHYIVYDETVNCINSILDSIKDSIYQTDIVVVDNGSPNDSYQKLQSKYKNVKNIHLIKNEENIGFARGNNVGFIYSKKILNSDFIILLNNDIIVSQNNINEIIVKKYNENKYAILGPDIITKDNYHQNPRDIANWSNYNIKKFRLKKRLQLFLTYFPFTNKFLTINSAAFSKEKYNKDKKNVQLHGAFLIFSKEYIRRFNGIYNKTFLYMEEDILRLIAEQNNLLMMYTSDITVFHKEDAATDAINDRTIIKKRNIYRNLLASSKLYMKLKKQYNHNSFIYKIISKMGKRIKGNNYEINKDIPDVYLLNLIVNRIFMIFRGILKFGPKSIKKRIFIGKNVSIKDSKNIIFNNVVTIGDNCEIDALSEEGIYFSSNTSIGKNSIIRCTGNIKKVGKGFYIGNNSSLADNCFVGATGGVWIGDNVIGGQNIRFHSSNHIFSDLSIPIKQQGIIAKGIYIGNNCWIGSGVVFCDGVNIGDGCVIGANSIVTKSFPNNCVIAGNPAKIIKVRGDQ